MEGRRLNAVSVRPFISRSRTLRIADYDDDDDSHLSSCLHFIQPSAAHQLFAPFYDAKIASVAIH